MAMLTVPSGESLMFPVDARWLQNRGINKIYIPTDDPPRECPESESENPTDVHYLCADCADTDSVVVILNWADDTYQVGNPVDEPGVPQSGIEAYLNTLGFFHVQPRFSAKPTMTRAKKQELVMGTPPDVPDKYKEPDETPDQQIKRLRRKHNRNPKLKRYVVP